MKLSFPLQLSILSLFCFLDLGVCALGAEEGKIRWRVIEPGFATEDVVVVGCSVKDFGAIGDGRNNDTWAFQKAMDALAERGGGCVFAPTGRYAIRGLLRVPSGVTLRGEWKRPQKGRALKGTVLQAYAGRFNASGKPFVTIGPSGGLRDLSIWYPEQRPDNIVEYPWCVKQEEGDNATVENVTLVNPYQGIKIGPEFNELHYLHEVYGSPLAVGLEFDGTTDIGRLEGVYFSPDVWSESGLPGAPARGGAHARWMAEKGVGIRMYRSDWEYGTRVRIRGYSVGFEIAGSPKGFPNAQFSYFEITECGTALKVRGVNPFGIAFTRCRFEGEEFALFASESFDSVLQFHDCALSGAASVRSEGSGHLAFQHCEFKSGTLEIQSGSLSLIDSDLGIMDPHVSLGREVLAATCLSNRFTDEPHIENKSSGDVQIDHRPVEFDVLPDFVAPEPPSLRPAKSDLFVVTEPPFSAPSDGSKDATLAVRKAIRAARENGGGVVLFPGGRYLLGDSLTVPSGVELRGVRESPHHTQSGGSVILVRHGKGKGAESPPTITLEAHSGVRGLTFHYPDQDFRKPAAYPFLMRGAGAGVYIIRVSASNPYNFIDLSRQACDGHYLDYVSGAPLFRGIVVGGSSSGGSIRNTQFNPHYWFRSPFKNSPRGKDWDYLWTFQKENLDALILGDCREEFLFQNFVYGSIYGIHLKDEGGRGPSGVVLGHGTDGSKVSVFIESVGEKGMDFVNTQLVCMSSENKKYFLFDMGEKNSRKVCFFNTLLWGHPDESGVLENGSLTLQLANFHKKGDEGFLLKGGRFRLVNSYFWESSTHIRVMGFEEPPTLIGNVFKGRLYHSVPESKIGHDSNDLLPGIELIDFHNVGRASRR